MRSKAFISYLTSPLLAAALAVAPIQSDAAPAKTAPAKTTTPTKTTPSKTVPTEEVAPEETTPEEPAAAEAGEEPAGEDAGAEAGDTDTDGAAEAGEEEVVPEDPPPEVTEPPPPEPKAVVEEPDPMADRPLEPTVGGKPRKGLGLMIAGGAVLAGGLASTITFVMVTGDRCSLDGPLHCKHKTQDQFLIPMGAAITLLGAMLLAVGVGYHFQYKKWERWTPADAQKKKRGRRATASLPGPTLLRQGAGLSLSGRF